MSDVQRIVKALELAIQDSTFQQPAPHTTFFKRPEMINHIDGETLKAAVQAVINIYKEEQVLLSSTTKVEVTND